MSASMVNRTSFLWVIAMPSGRQDGFDVPICTFLSMEGFRLVSAESVRMELGKKRGEAGTPFPLILVDNDRYFKGQLLPAFQDRPFVDKAEFLGSAITIWSATISPGGPVCDSKGSMMICPPWGRHRLPHASICSAGRREHNKVFYRRVRGRDFWARWGISCHRDALSKRCTFSGPRI